MNFRLLILDKHGGEGGVASEHKEPMNSLNRTDPRKWFSPSVYHRNMKQQQVLLPETTGSIQAQSYFAHVSGEMRNLQENVSVIEIGAVTVTTTAAPVGSAHVSSCSDLVLWNHNQLDLHAFASGVVSGKHSWLLFKFHFLSGPSLQNLFSLSYLFLYVLIEKQHFISGVLIPAFPAVADNIQLCFHRSAQMQMETVTIYFWKELE